MLRRFYKNWIRIEFDEPEEEMEMKWYTVMFIIGAALAVIGICGLDSEAYQPFLAMFGCGAGLSVIGAAVWINRGGVDHED